MDDEIPELGDRAKDIITGLEGIVIAETDWMYGCKHVSIKLEGLNKDKKPNESSSFDIQRVKVVKKGVVKVERPPRISNINHGDIVEDMITGYRGAVTGYTQWISGYLNIHVQAESLVDGKPVEAQSFEEPVLKVIKKAKFKTPEKVPVSRQTVDSHPGGPASIPRMSR